uniref:Uncharacterized protein n=1 Tax=Rhizophora mucronata TaxID=61149 RepID=A0A2P2NCU6_RHIMU
MTEHCICNLSSFRVCLELWLWFKNLYFE